MLFGDDHSKNFCFNKSKDQIMHLRQDNPGYYTCKLGDEKLDCSTMERDLGVLD